MIGGELRRPVNMGIATLGAVEIGRRITLGAEYSQGGNFGRRITLGAASLWVPFRKINLLIPFSCNTNQLVYSDMLKPQNNQI